MALFLTGCLGGLGGGTTNLESELSAVITQFGNYFKNLNTSGLASLYAYPATFGIIDLGEIQIDDSALMKECWDIMFEDIKMVHSVETEVTNASGQGNTATAIAILIADITEEEIGGVDKRADLNLVMEVTFQKKDSHDLRVKT